ncbi:hypothetical protein PGTUg99_050213 [Puccinia graminis f. sp. tritici]|uniref:Integrase catalytic domain-containing protein n=1 Tax=Puccinia graminis f. sp. tritici TaxID=56615 RepID=A0A5B0NHB2_PUCGR|nr:hypothetical protein PGTUg99_050213 [Puccinia graminis f. sp. tritici]
MDSQEKRPYQHPCEKGHDPREKHSQKNCWYDNPHKKPKRFQSNNRYAKANVARASQSHDTQAQSSSSNDNNENAVPAFSYCSIVKTSPIVKLGAILDSGASNHMFNSLDFFVDSEPVFIFIITGDGKSREELVATRKGTALIQLADDKIITLKNSLFVPNLTRNLVSLSQLIDNNISIQRAGKLFNVILNNQEKLFSLDLSNQLFEISGDVSPVQQQTIAMISNASEPTGFTKWHNRLGHASKDRLKVVIPSKESLMKEHCCDACMKGKMTRKSFTHHFDSTSTSLEVVHGDLVGPITPSSNGGARYFLTLVDQHTGYINITILKEKSEAPNAIDKFRIFYENQTGNRMKKLVTDGGGEFCNKTLSGLLESAGVQHNISPPYTPQQNGIAERANRTILSMTRCILLHSNLASEWWAEAVKTSCAITNCLPSLSKSRTSPIELLFKKKPNINIFRPFGCKVWSLKPEVHHERKFDSLAWEGVLIGYANDYSTYKVVRLDNLQIINVKHAYFEENIFPACPALRKSNDNLDASNNLPIFQKVPSLPFEEESLPTEEKENDQSQELLEEEIISEKQLDVDTRQDSNKLISSNIDESNILNYSRRTALISLAPKTHHQAMKGEETDKWKEAEKKEYENMDSHKAWLVRKRKEDDSPIPLTWAFRKKLGSNNEVTEFKARICVQGFRQSFGLDYFAKYAPTGKPCSLRLLISFAVNNDLKIHQLDVRSAFLTCPLEDKVTVLPPPGYVGKPDTVFELRKAVYGLRQAPLVWYKRLSNFLKSINFNISVSDPCVFWRTQQPGRPMTWIYAHVDDLVIISSDPLVFKQEIEKEFAIKYLGDAEFLLGMNITRKNGSIKINQLQYIERKLVQFNLQDAYPASCPLNPRIQFDKATQDDQEALKQLGFNYRSIVGSLNYLSILTRPDISYAVSALSQFLENPGLSHYRAAEQVFRYISGTREMGLLYQKQESSDLKAYVDADWGNCLITRRSVTGYVTMAGHHLLSWKSSKQDTVSLSSAEAEYKSLSDLSREMVWITSLVNETQVQKTPSNIQVFVDNKAAIDLANSETAQNGFRTKHMNIRLHFVREHIQSHLLRLIYIKSNENPADFLTKAVGRCTIRRSLKALGIAYQSKTASNLTTRSTEDCWNVIPCPSPRKRRLSETSCSIEELDRAKLVACETGVDVSDVRRMNNNDDCDHSSNSSSRSSNCTPNKLIDRIFPAIVVDSVAGQQSTV